MLHHRGTGSIPSIPPIATTSSPAPKNKAYQPLRRESNQFYSSSPSSSKPRYPVQSQSPGNILSSPSLGGGYFPSTTPSGSAVSNGSYASGYGQNAANGTGYGQSYGGSTFDLNDGVGTSLKSKEEWLHAARIVLDRFRQGFGDASRLDRSWAMVWQDVELRTLVLKSTLINLVSLLLLSMSPIVLSPALTLSPGAQDRAKSVSRWYNLLLSWPVFVFCFWINAYWGPDISRRAQTLLHPAYRHQPSTPKMTSSSSARTDSTQTLLPKIFATVQRLLLISDFTMVSRLILLIPMLGRPMAFTYMCIINAYYCFDWTFASRGWGLNHRVTYMQDRVAYMVGFGLPTTFLSSFAAPLVNMAIFALIFPFFVIQALLSRPPSSTSLLPATPSPHSSFPPSPSDPSGGSLNTSDSFFNPSTAANGLGNIKVNSFVPIFFFARFAIEWLAWLEAALGRRAGIGSTGTGLGMRERPGKRLM